MQPALIVWNDGSGANNPDTGFTFFHQHMAAGVLLAQGNLPVAANELQRGEVGCGKVGCGGVGCGGVAGLSDRSARNLRFV